MSIWRVFLVFAALYVSRLDAAQVGACDVIGKWYRVVPGCSLFLNFRADGKCEVDQRVFDGRKTYSAKVTTIWRFDGWCIVIEPEEGSSAEKVIPKTWRLSLIELEDGQRVLGYWLRWDKKAGGFQADVFLKGEYTPVFTPDLPSEKATK
ncbi:MAG: hypothetical protein HZA31_10235 [Opitutae bacterium]|nr:hypothetical protein [Opitutae bacterium]